MILYLVEKLVIRNSLWNQRNSKVVLLRISNWISTGFPSRTIALLLPKSRISSTSVLDLKEYINETHIHYISYSTMIFVLELYIQKFDNIFAIVCLHKFLYWVMCRIPNRVQWDSKFRYGHAKVTGHWRHHQTLESYILCILRYVCSLMCMHIDMYIFCT